MIGKKNVVFGFLFLMITAALGPLMIIKYIPEVAVAQSQKQDVVGRLQSLKADDFEEELEPLTPQQIAKANTDGVLALNQLINAQQPIDVIRSGPHAHGNMEALLNIVVGIALSFMAISRVFKQLISWIFIVGTLMHSGLLYLGVMLEMELAFTVLNTGIGPGLVLLGLLLAAIAAAIGLKAQVVRD
ncbi:MAG: hypothetical protein GXP08_02205 [Gammaproteobacteria bacterium]|nr:hypothetical protein [Gammaproteobacteria bacterium]